MARPPRPVVPGVPLHITQRGNNRLNCFFASGDYPMYLDLLQSAAYDASCQVHAYVLMTNHVHLLVSPKHESGPSVLMKSLGERYVQYVNRRHSRTGALWEGRYHSCLVQSERYLMVCQRYIELNPVRAGLTIHPVDYPWSSYRRNAHGGGSFPVTPHELYDRLGSHASSREDAYRELFKDVLTEERLVELRQATHANRLLGTQKFKTEMTKMLGRPAPRTTADLPERIKRTDSSGSRWQPGSELALTSVSGRTRVAAPLPTSKNENACRSSERSLLQAFL
jgi:putative transposase